MAENWLREGGSGKIRIDKFDNFGKTSGMETEFIQASVARNTFGELMRTAIRGRRTIVTTYGKPVAVLISFDEYEGIQASLERLRSADRQKLIP